MIALALARALALAVTLVFAQAWSGACGEAVAAEPAQAGAAEPVKAGTAEPVKAGAAEPAQAGAEPAQAGAAEPAKAGVAEPAPAASSDLIVGSVRDADGAPIVRADVRAYDGRGSLVGSDRTDADGTFALAPAGRATRVGIACAHCPPTTLQLGAQTNLVIVVARYRALETDVPDARDLAALPYGAPAEALGLVPFIVPGPTANAVSDRGLGGGIGLVSDDGAAILDFATGMPASDDLPDRYARSLGVVRADRAYRYGSDAGAGLFGLDTLAPRSAADADAGAAPSFAVAPVAGDVHAAYGASSDGVLARRGDLDVVTTLGGGTVRAGAAAASERFAYPAGDTARHVDLLRLAYATAGRAYRTTGGVAASAVGADDTRDGGNAYRSSYLETDVRVERSGPVALAFGAHAAARTASYAQRGAQPYALVGGANAETLYAEADTDAGKVALHGALALASAAAVESLSYGGARTSTVRVKPAFDARVSLGGGAYARAGFSQSQRIPTLLESDAAATTAPPALAFDRAQLLESALGFDAGGRVRAELDAYRQTTRGFEGGDFGGLGASLVWQIAPSVALRAWSLRATPQDGALATRSAPDVSRGVVWTTYANGDGLRVDAIVRRERAPDGRLAADLDADVLVPLAAGVALDLATSRVRGDRRFSAGLRFR